jgi:hypothetical protein
MNSDCSTVDGSGRAPVDRRFAKLGWQIALASGLFGGHRLWRLVHFSIVVFKPT